MAFSFQTQNGKPLYVCMYIFSLRVMGLTMGSPWSIPLGSLWSSQHSGGHCFSTLPKLDHFNNRF